MNFYTRQMQGDKVEPLHDNAHGRYINKQVLIQFNVRAT